MSILINKDTTVIIQGITGREAVNLTREGLDYGTKIVGGVTPGRAGRDVYGVPVYDCVRDITSKQHVDGSIVTVPALGTRIPIIMRMVVVLPAPFGPRNPNTSPRSTENSRSRTAVKPP